jgi:hypothetical protein
MPLNVNFAFDPTKRRRNRTQQPQTFQPNALNLSGVESRLNTMTAGLQPDLQAEQDARMSELERTLGETRAQLGRQFALTPGGTTTPGLQGGEQQRGFENLELGALSLQDKIRADVAARTGAEQRANIGVLSGLQQQQFGQGAQNRQQIEAERAQGAQEELQAGQLIGTFQGQQTLASAAQSADINLRNRALDLQAEVQRGQLSIEQANQQLNDFVQRGQLGVAQRQVSVAEGAQSADTRIREEALRLQAEIQRGQLSVSQADQRLNDFIQRGQLGIAQQQVDEQTRQFDATQTLRTTELMGVAQGASASYDEIAQRFGWMGLGSAETIRNAEAMGMVYDPVSHTFSAAPKLTLQAAAQQAQLTGDFIDPRTGETIDTIAKTQQAFNERIEEANLTGVWDDGTVKDMETLAARALALREGELTGTVGDKQTIAAKALALQQEIQRGSLALQKSAQAFGQRITEAELTGVYQKMGTEETGAFQAAFNAQEGDANFNPRYDLDGDGKIDFQDWLNFAAISNNAPVQTVQAQALQEQKLLREFNEKVTAAGLTGTYQGQQTVQEEQRRFQNQMTEAQLFVDAPPVTLGWNDFTKSFNAKMGDPNYDAHMDFDRNGVINFTDFVSLAGSDRVSIMSGSIDNPASLVFTYRPEGKITAIAAQLGLDERRLSEQTRQFNETLQQQQQQFLTNATGLIVNPDGTFDTSGMTTLEKQQFEEQKTQFNDQFDEQVRQFGLQLGLSEDRLDVEKDAVMAQLIAAGIGAGASVLTTTLKKGEALTLSGEIMNGAKKIVSGSTVLGAAGPAAALIAGTFALGYGLNKLFGDGRSSEQRVIDQSTRFVNNVKQRHGEGVINSPQFAAFLEDSEIQAALKQISSVAPDYAVADWLSAAWDAKKDSYPQQAAPNGAAPFPVNNTQPAQQATSTYKPTQADMPAFNASYNAVRGRDGNYDARFDFDSDGVISQSDFIQFASKAGSQAQTPASKPTVSNVPNVGSINGATVERVLQYAGIPIAQAANLSEQDILSLANRGGGIANFS